MKLLPLIIVALVIPAAIAQDETPEYLAIARDDAPEYFCIAELATGIIFENGAWTSTTFDVSDRRYLFRRTGINDSKDLKEFKWVYRDLKFDWVSGCDDGPYPLIAKTIKCGDDGKGYTIKPITGREISVNTTTLRYQLVRHNFAYVNGSDITGYIKDGDDPYDYANYIEIGKCSPL